MDKRKDQPQKCCRIWTSILQSTKTPAHKSAKPYRAACPAVICIEMNGYKEITFVLLRLVADMIEVIVLTKDNRDSISFLILLDAQGQFIGRITFTQMQVAIDGARIKLPIVPGIEIYFHSTPFNKYCLTIVLSFVVHRVRGLTAPLVARRSSQNHVTCSR